MTGTAKFEVAQRANEATLANPRPWPRAARQVRKWCCGRLLHRHV